MSRYSQQILVSEIGVLGQQRIRRAKLLVVGAGGLGTSVATYLVAMGVGMVYLADGDKVALSNLQRQYLYLPNEVGNFKTSVLSQRLQAQNPDVQVVSIPNFVDVASLRTLVEKVDLVCDCTDNVDTRISIDQVCHELNKPLVYAAVRDWEGYITVLHHKNKLRLSDIFGLDDLRYNAQNKCTIAGIVATTCGIAGSIQATEALKIILHSNDVLDGKILCFNASNHQYKTFNLKRL